VQVAPFESNSETRRQGLVVATLGLFAVGVFPLARLGGGFGGGLGLLVTFVCLVTGGTCLVWGVAAIVTDQWRAMTPVRAAAVPPIAVATVLVTLPYSDGALISVQFDTTGGLVENAVRTFTFSNVGYLVPGSMFAMIGSALRRKRAVEIVASVALPAVLILNLRLSYGDASAFQPVLALLACLCGVLPAVVAYRSTQPPSRAPLS